MKYTKGYKYVLAENFMKIINIKPKNNIETLFIDLDTDGKLSIKKGYAWDGPSGPTIDTNTFMRAALVHDSLYQLIRVGFIPLECRELADKELRIICKEDGMNSFRAWYVYKGVRSFGESSAENKRKIYTAP